MPWTITSYEEAAIAFDPSDGMLYEVTNDAYEDVGLHLIWCCTGGGYGIGNNVRPIKTPEDFKNLKMRVSSSVPYVRTLENMAAGTGLTMETIPWADIYNALERGVADGCWDVWSALLEERHFEVLDYYTALNFGWETENIIINKELWDGLPKDLQDALSRAGEMARLRDYEAVRELEVQIKNEVAKAGLEIYYPTPDERELFREKANMGAVWEEVYGTQLEERYPDEDMIDDVRAELERIREYVAAAGVE
jgi:C4-dicarboxylate-binding protein DctP